MSHSNQETGHYKNVASFHSLIQLCEALGEKYKPARTELTLTALHNRISNVDNMMERWSKALAALDIAVKQRSDAFEQLPKFCTRLMSALEQANPVSPAIPGVKHLVAKIRGRRIGKIEAPETQDAGTPAPAHISVSQTSFDALLDHFAHILHRLAEEPAYTANEPEMSLEGLQTMLDLFTQYNTHVVTLQAQYQRLIAERDEMLYGPVSGLLPLSVAVKKYFIMILGTDSQELKAARALVFRTM